MKNQKREGKMCPYYDKKGYKVFGGQLIAHCRSIFKGGIKCPGGTDNNCQIIAPQKSKTVKIKATAFIYLDRNGKERWHADQDKFVAPIRFYPCHILIDRKDIEGKK